MESRVNFSLVKGDGDRGQLGHNWVLDRPCWEGQKLAFTKSRNYIFGQISSPKELSDEKKSDHVLGAAWVRKTLVFGEGFLTTRHDVCADGKGPMFVVKNDPKIMSKIIIAYIPAPSKGCQLNPKGW